MARAQCQVKYMIHTAMEEGGGLVLASKVVCIGEEVQSSNTSNAMVVEGLHRCLDEVEAHCVAIEGLATATRTGDKLYEEVETKH